MPTSLLLSPRLNPFTFLPDLPLFLSQRLQLHLGGHFPTTTSISTTGTRIPSLFGLLVAPIGPIHRSKSCGIWPSGCGDIAVEVFPLLECLAVILGSPACFHSIFRTQALTIILSDFPKPLVHRLHRSQDLPPYFLGPAEVFPFWVARISRTARPFPSIFCTHPLPNTLSSPTNSFGNRSSRSRDLHPSPPHHPVRHCLVLAFLKADRLVVLPA